MPTMTTHFTLTERRILNVLADGLPHAREEFRAALWDEEGALSNVEPHISRLRRKLPADHEIICQFHMGRYKYRWLRPQGGGNGDGK